MIEHWPQSVMLALNALGVCAGLVKAGIERSIGPALTGIIIAHGNLWTPYQGGFYAVFGWSP